MVFNATFNNIELYRSDQFYWQSKPKYPEKTTDLPQVTDKLYQPPLSCHILTMTCNIFNSMQ
jgi:hypothetical protein